MLWLARSPLEGGETMPSTEANEIYPGVTVNPRVLGGTRIPISVIVGHLAVGDTVEIVMDEYRITHERILAALISARRRQQP